MDTTPERQEMYDSALDLIAILLKEEIGEDSLSYETIYRSITNEFFTLWKQGQEMQLNALPSADFDNNDTVRLMFVFLVLLEQELINEDILPEDAELLSIVGIAEDADVIATALESLAHTLHFHLILHNKAKQIGKDNE